MYTLRFFKQEFTDVYTNIYSRAGNSRECFPYNHECHLAANESLSYCCYSNVDFDKDSSQTSFMEIHCEP